MSEKIIGIDFGTTNCCFAIWDNKDVKIIINDNSETITPSIISFTNNGRIIGTYAKKNSSKNYKNIIYGIKRLIGRNFDDPKIQKDIKYWPFKVIKDSITGKAKIEVEYNNKIQIFTPEEIISMILSKIKDYCKNYLGEEIKNVIITVPTYFNDIQRKSMKMAFEIAEFNVINIINEPIAAAISYGLNNNKCYNRNVLIFDLGGGTFDVTILTINNNKFDIKATDGDVHFGGDDFDNLLVEYCIKKFKENSGIDISNDNKAIKRLKIECEKTKIELSFKDDSEISIDCLAEGEDFSITIYRSKFEEICENLFNKIIPIIKNVIIHSNISKDKIDDIVLVGGSSKIPKIQKILKLYFEKEPLKTINPEEAVARGAAIYGAFKEQFLDKNNFNYKINNITSLSYGLELDNGEMDIIIPKNSMIPFEKTQKYQTAEDNQTKAKIIVYQGENFYTKDNTFIDEYTIANITPKPKGKITFDVTFKINQNGILKVYSVESGEGQINKLKVNVNKGFSKKNFEEVKNRFNEINEEEKKINLEKKYRNELYNYAYELKEHENYSVRQKANDTINWLNNNEILNITQIINKRNSLKDTLKYFKKKN